MIDEVNNNCIVNEEEAPNLAEAARMMAQRAKEVIKKYDSEPNIREE